MDTAWSEEADGTLSAAADRDVFAAFLADLTAVPPRQAVAVHQDTAEDLATAALWRRIILQTGVEVATALPADVPPPPGARLFALGNAQVGTPAHRIACPDLATFSPLQQRVACDAVWLWELAGSPDGSAWLAALGCVGKAGRVPVRWLRDVMARHTAKFLRLTTVLLDVAARSPRVAGAVELALEVLHGADSPRSFAAHPRVQLLLGLRSEYEEAVRKAQDTEPYMCGRLAVYQMESRFSMEDRLAEAWAAKMRPRVTLVGNRFTPDRVRFVVRSSCTMSAMDFLRGAGWPPNHLAERGEVSLDVWHLLLRRLHVAV